MPAFLRDFPFSYSRVRIRKRGRPVNAVGRTIVAYRRVFLRKSAMTADDRRHTAVRSGFLRQGTSGPEGSDSLTDIADARLEPKLFAIVCKISISCIACFPAIVTGAQSTSFYSTFRSRGPDNLISEQTVCTS